MRYDGQLCTYNYGNSGPCYRCVFPVPPRPASVGNCEDVGVLGVVTGVVGTLQAMEAIKLLTKLNNGEPCNRFCRGIFQLHNAPHHRRSNTVNAAIFGSFCITLQGGEATI